MTSSRVNGGPPPVEKTFRWRDCVERAAFNLSAAEDQLSRREQLFPVDVADIAAHTRNRIELGAAWCLLAEQITEGDRP